jgi:hypothetical protein
MTQLGRAALAYATRLNWPVFPCKPRSKEPLTTHGFHDASTDDQIIRQWWSRWPTANVAIATDARSRLLVIDVDPRHGGDDELAELEHQHGALPHTIMGLTGGGGEHHIFHRPEGVSFRGHLAPGIDIKHAGYIMAPPSVHPDTGRTYFWEAGSRPIETDIAELPAWVLTRIIRIESPEYGEPADDAAKSFLARAFAHAGWLGSRIDAARINARCPWENEHTQRSGSGGAVIFAPRSGSGAGWFHCSHTSHGPKTLRDVLSVLPHSALRQASADVCVDVASDRYEADERAAIQEET